MCQCRTPAGTPLPCEYCWCIPGFCQLLANMKTLFLNPQQLLYKLLLKDFPNAFWKSSWLYLLDFPFLLTLACQCFQRNLTDTWVMTTDAKCDEHTIFIHICTPPVPSNSFLTRLWNGGGEWVPGEWKLRVFLMFLYIFLPQKTACLPPKKNWESRNSSSSQQVEAKAIAK